MHLCPSKICVMLELPDFIRKTLVFKTVLVDIDVIEDNLCGGQESHCET